MHQRVQNYCSAGLRGFRNACVMLPKTKISYLGQCSFCITPAVNNREIKPFIHNLTVRLDLKGRNGAWKEVKHQSSFPSLQRSFVCDITWDVSKSRSLISRMNIHKSQQAGVKTAFNLLGKTTVTTKSEECLTEAFRNNPLFAVADRDLPDVSPAVNTCATRTLMHGNVLH